MWDGVYTVEQARRGGELAADRCVACHGDRLAGGESAPPLAGDQFNATWEGVMLSDLFDRIRMTMPLENPGSLTRQQTADVLAYMLSPAVSGRSIGDGHRRGLPRADQVSSATGRAVEGGSMSRPVFVRV